MSSRPAAIDEAVRAFDDVIPGYAWAWHDANAAKFKRSFGTAETSGWRDKRRTRLNRDRDRCLLVYGMRIAEENVVLFNRGYLELARVRFPDIERASTKLMEFATNHSRSKWQKGHDAWFYNDACGFAERTAITLRVLDFIRAHAVDLEPLWQDGDLTRSS